MNGANQNQYPPEEEFIVQLLMRQIATAQRWIDVTQAADAIFHVQLMAKGMRDERNQFVRENGGGPMGEAARAPVNKSVTDVAGKMA